MSCVTLNLVPSINLNGRNASVNSARLSNSLSCVFGNSSSSSFSFLGYLSSSDSKNRCDSRRVIKGCRSFSSVFKCVSQKSEPSVSINARGNGASGKNWGFTLWYL